MAEPAYEPLPFDYDEVLPGGPIARWRAFFWPTFAAALVSAVIGAAVGLYVTSDVHTTVRSQVKSATASAARHNCLTQQAGRESANRQRFAERELLRFDTDILTASARAPHRTAQQRHSLTVFLATESARLQADYRAAHIAGLRPVRTFADLFPYLNNIAQLSCDGDLLLGGN